MVEQKPIVSSMTILNVMLGTGPLIVPHVFLVGGWGMASIFMIVMGIISLITALFCVEALSIVNAIKSNQIDERFMTQTTDNQNKLNINSSLIRTNIIHETDVVI